MQNLYMKLLFFSVLMSGNFIVGIHQSDGFSKGNSIPVFNVGYDSNLQRFIVQNDVPRVGAVSREQLDAVIGRPEAYSLLYNNESFARLKQVHHDKYGGVLLFLQLNKSEQGGVFLASGREDILQYISHRNDEESQLVAINVVPLDDWKIVRDWNRMPAWKKGLCVISVPLLWLFQYGGRCN